MKTVTRLIFLLFSFSIVSSGQMYGFSSVSPGVSGKVVPGVIAPVLQRGRVVPQVAAESGYAVIDLVGTDDMVDVFLRGEQATYKTVKGQNPRSITADFSSSIPAVPGLVLSVSKLSGRGNVSLTGKPDRVNGYNITLRVTDSARGSDNYRIRVDWRLPATGPVAASVPSRSAPQAAKREIASRISNTRNVEKGYVELKVDGVDDIVEVEISGNSARYLTVRGTSPRKVEAEFSNPIPRDASLSLDIVKSYGRGEISIIDKPTASNNYTAKVRLTDPRGGRDNYKFRINWDKGGAVRRPLPTKQEAISRTGSTRIVEKGYVELKVDGVDDIVDVEISDNSVRYLTVRGNSPQKVAAEFSNPVPRDATLRLDIVKSYGRGDISITERPAAANNYTATIRLTDPRGGRDNYKFRINWDKDGAVRTRSSARTGYSTGYIPARSGHVDVSVDGADDILDIKIAGDQVVQNTIKGGTPRQVRSQFSTPLPRVPLTGLVLKKISGRGNVVLMEGPDQANNYTATVRIMDSERAQDNYSFSLSWEVAENVSAPVSSGYNDYENTFDSTIGQGNYQGIPSYSASSFTFTKEGSFEFRAIVDDTALIKIEDGRLWGTVLQGQPMRVLDARFSDGYPQGDMERLEVTRFRGRGEVEILEKPWSGNNYSIVIRIHDSRGGDDEYGFRLQWKQR